MKNIKYLYGHGYQNCGIECSASIKDSLEDVFECVFTDADMEGEIEIIDNVINVRCWTLAEEGNPDKQHEYSILNHVKSIETFFAKFSDEHTGERDGYWLSMIEIVDNQIKYL